MMDPNSYGNILPPQNYNLPYATHHISPNQYYYKDFTPCSTDIADYENAALKVVSTCQRSTEINNGTRKVKRVIKVKRRSFNKENDLKTTQRLRRLRGESYVDSKGRERPARLMLPAPCRGKMKHKCCNEVTDEDRKLIYMEFRQLKSYQAQWQFIASHLIIHLKKRSTGGNRERPSRREFTYTYYLTAKGIKKRVCREFFLSTLNVTESLIKTSLNKLSPQGVCQDDRRGRKTPQNKLSEDDENFIRKHILSFPTIMKKSSLKKYLDNNLNVSEMFKMYVAKCNCECRKPVSLEKYRLIFKQYNLSFLKKKGIKSRSKVPSFEDQKQSTCNVNQNYNLPTISSTTDYQPNGEGLLDELSYGNDNFALTSYLLGVETAKEYNDKRISTDNGSQYSTFCVRSNLEEPLNCQDSTNLYNIPNKKPLSSDGEYFYDHGRTGIVSPHIETSEIEDGKNKIKLFPKSKIISSRLKKLRGESYIDSKGREKPARPMKAAPCRGKNKHNGCDQVSEDDRASIYTEFRQLSSYQAQWQFVASHVTVQSKRRCTSQGPSRREKTFIYYLTARGVRFKVCREFFLSTLSVTESLVKTSVNKLSPQGICQEDKRGRQTPKNKLNSVTEDYLRQHILSFPTTTRKNSTKLFLDSNLSIVEMHRMYMSKCIQDGLKHVSVEKYRTVCKELNLVIPKTKKSRTCKSNVLTYQQPQVFDPSQQTSCSQYNGPYVNNDLRNFHEYEEKTFRNIAENNVPENDLRSLLYIPEGT